MDEDPMAPLPEAERSFDAGPGRTIAVHVSDDSGEELDPFAFFASIARAAVARSANGDRLLSLASLPLRHTGVYFGRQSSGYESKAVVAALYANEAETR